MKVSILSIIYHIILFFSFFTLFLTTEHCFIANFFEGTAGSVMCDVIKIRLKGKDERRSGKGNPLKRDGFL